MRPFSREEKKALFDGKQVSSLLPYDDIDGNAQVLDIIREGNGRLSISGAQEKFAMVEDGTGFYRLAPAYDLLNTQIHLPTSIFALEKGLFKEGTPILDTTPIGRPLFEQFGRRIALPEETVQRELDDFALVRPEVDEMIGNSLLSDKAKEDYLASYKYRLSTMQK